MKDTNWKDIHLYGCWLSRFGPVALWYCRLRMAGIWGFYIPYDGMTMIKSYYWYYFLLVFDDTLWLSVEDYYHFFRRGTSHSTFIARLVPYTWLVSVMGIPQCRYSILRFDVEYSFDIRREISTLYMTSSKSWILPFWWDSSSTFVVSLAPYRQPFQVMEITILVGHLNLIDIRRDFSTQYMTFPCHVYIHFGGTSHRHSSWV